MRTILVFPVKLNIYLAQAQIEPITSRLTAVAAIQQIKNGLSEVVDDALDRANYTIAQSAIQALGVIDAWKKANSELLTTAFDRHDQSTKHIFSKTSSDENQIKTSVLNELDYMRLFRNRVVQSPT